MSVSNKTNYNKNKKYWKIKNKKKTCQLPHIFNRYDKIDKDNLFNVRYTGGGLPNPRATGS